jgi:hypothetical protein
MSKKGASSSSSSSSKRGSKNNEVDGVPGIDGDNQEVLTGTATRILSDLNAFLAPATLDLKGAFKIIFMLDCLERKAAEPKNVAIVSEILCVEATFQKALMQALNKGGKLAALRTTFDNVKKTWIKSVEIDSRIDVYDVTGACWNAAKVTWKAGAKDKADKKDCISVSFIGWAAKWDLTLGVFDGFIAPANTFTIPKKVPKTKEENRQEREKQQAEDEAAAAVVAAAAAEAAAAKAEAAGGTADAEQPMEVEGEGEGEGEEGDLSTRHRRTSRSCNGNGHSSSQESGDKKRRRKSNGNGEEKEAEGAGEGAGEAGTVEEEAEDNNEWVCRYFFFNT